MTLPRPHSHYLLDFSNGKSNPLQHYGLVQKGRLRHTGNTGLVRIQTQVS